MKRWQTRAHLKNPVALVYACAYQLPTLVELCELQMTMLEHHFLEVDYTFQIRREGVSLDARAPLQDAASTLLDICHPQNIDLLQN